MLEDSIDDDKVEVDEAKTKKKKKKRHSEVDNAETTPAAVDDESMVVTEEDSTKKKHKKKKHHITEDNEDITTNANQLDIQLLSDSQPPVVGEIVDGSVSKKRKKSKKKSPGIYSYNALFCCLISQQPHTAIHSYSVVSTLASAHFYT